MFFVATIPLPYLASITLASDRQPSVTHLLYGGGRLKPGRAGNGDWPEVDLVTGPGAHVTDRVSCHPAAGLWRVRTSRACGSIRWLCSVGWWVSPRA